MATDPDETQKPRNAPKKASGDGSESTPKKARSPRAKGANSQAANAKAGPKADAKTDAQANAKPETGKSAERLEAPGAGAKAQAPSEAAGEIAGEVAGEVPMEILGEEPVVVVMGVDITHEPSESRLVGLDLGAGLEAGLPPGVIGSIAGMPLDELVPPGEPEGGSLDNADMIVEMLNGLAEASSDTLETPIVEPEIAVAPVWYVMVHQIEDAERSVAKQRKAGRLARRLARQLERAAALLHDVFEQAAAGDDVLSRHERAIARLMALIEVTPPPDKASQRVFAGIIRTERRSLARALKAEREP